MYRKPISVAENRTPMPLPKTMRAVVYRGKGDLRLETVPLPSIRSGELLVRVAACGVCPTDIKKIQLGTVPPPRIFGHETAGTIVKTGSLVRSFQVGDRVALHHHVPCQKCHFCRHKAFAQCLTYKRTGITAGFEPAGGGFAEYVRVMPFVLPGVVKIPRRNDFVEGAMLEPINTVLKAVRQLPLLRDDTVLVVGQGPIGLMFTRLLTLAGMRVIATDLIPERRSLGRRFGAWRVLDAADPDLSEQLHRATRGRGLDAAILTVAADAPLRQAQTALRGGGTLQLFAHTVRGQTTALDLSQVCVDEKPLLGSYSADVTLQSTVARLVFSRQFDVRPLITHEFGLEQTAAAIELAAHPTPDSLKIIVSAGTATGPIA